MSSTTCGKCGKPFVGSVCPRCAFAAVRGPVFESIAGRAESLGENDFLGPFKIIRCIGEGGMSRVYEAKDMNLGRKVAIKVPKAEVLRDPTACEWFIQEGRSIARMDNQHVVRVHHFDEFEGIPCHVMEFVEGENLKDKIHREKKLLPEEATRYGTDIAIGLTEIHLHGRIHGDIKPANIIVDRRATIVDFGLSSQHSCGNTDCRATAGTPAYMSPERAQGKPSGVGDDIYSLGCTMYEMLAGEPPHNGSSDTSVLNKAVDARPPAVGALTAVPQQLVDIVNRLIADDAIDRPASAKVVADLLGGWLVEKQRKQRIAWARRIACLAAFVAVLLVAAYFAVAYPRGDIGVLAADGTVRQRFATLAEAISAASDGDIIELRSNVPFTCDAALVSHRDITIRAAHDYRPIVEIKCQGDAKAAIDCQGSLALRGLTLRCWPNAAANAVSLLRCEGEKLEVTNCRFEQPLDTQGLTYLAAVGTNAVEVRDSVFVGCDGVAIGWQPLKTGHLNVSNCLTVTTTLVEYQVSDEPVQDRQLRIERCTLIGDHVLRVVPAVGNRSNLAAQLPTRVEAQSNVFRTSDALIQFAGWNLEEDAAETMAVHLDWRDQGNLHATRRDREVLWNPVDGEQQTFQTDSLTAWNRHWGMSVEDVDAIIVLGGNVEEFFGDGGSARAVRDLLQRFEKAGKKLCGIGDGPAVLADGGFLEGRRAVVQPRLESKLKDCGAILVPGEELVVSGNILTAESNFPTRRLIDQLPEDPVVLVLMAERDFWFDDFRAVQFEVHRRGGTLMTISTTTGAAKPAIAGGGSLLRPDLLLPLLRHDGGVNLRAIATNWLSTKMEEIDPFSFPASRFEIKAESLTNSASAALPGIDPDLVGPGGVPRQ